MAWLTTLLWVFGVWIVLYLIFRIIKGIRRRGSESPYKSEYYGR